MALLLVRMIWFAFYLLKTFSMLVLVVNAVLFMFSSLFFIQMASKICFRFLLLFLHRILILLVRIFLISVNKIILFFFLCFVIICCLIASESEKRSPYIPPLRLKGCKITCNYKTKQLYRKLTFSDRRKIFNDNT